MSDSGWVSVILQKERCIHKYLYVMVLIILKMMCAMYFAHEVYFVVPENRRRTSPKVFL